jgi:general secretion pathway protein G
MRSRRQTGFTLMEILIVVTIIGLLMTFVAPTLFAESGKAKRTIAERELLKIGEALELYKLQNGRYPTTEQGLAALVRKPTSEPVPSSYPPGGYLNEKQLVDPWGSTFRYESPGRNNTFSFDLSSLGPDGREDGEGEDADLVNWDRAWASDRRDTNATADAGGTAGNAERLLRPVLGGRTRSADGDDGRRSHDALRPERTAPGTATTVPRGQVLRAR